MTDQQPPDDSGRRVRLVPDDRPSLQECLGLSIIWGTGLLLGSFGMVHAVQSEIEPAGVLYVLTPIIFNAALLISGYQLWRHEITGSELLRIGGWVLVGMLVSGLLITWTVTHQLIRGESFAYDLFVTVNNMSFGALIGVILGWLDASNRRHERELAAERDRLDRQNERLEEFAGIVSHDLRNPLNVATLHLQTAREQTDHDSLDEIESALARMERIVEDVLTMARRGNEIEETQRVTLRTVAEDSWRNVETERATLSVEDEFAFQADRAKLGHIFENLFRNALEHGRTDPDETVSVSTGTCENGFYIEDDGPGIDPDDRDEIFEPGHSRRETGTGLGLSIVKRMAIAHNWEVTVTESDTGGARFEFTGIETSGRDPTDIIDETWDAVRTDGE